MIYRGEEISALNVGATMWWPHVAGAVYGADSYLTKVEALDAAKAIVDERIASCQQVRERPVLRVIDCQRERFEAGIGLVDGERGWE